ncbi:MAG: hypothetical protein GWM98_18615 [Nitrospinaceae bacterium]|nr:PilZ domain-containing protein [Nitrospinaceae bacterium]NIR56131.1 PilZ domain-containing protein [Nitrospinaceae bacterium]NIS86586.1 PilZ domain-containing protein [Nitrospinaceae bacterium]NIT83416.1 PilZ domain-containing protein [Nitrospinaceae bacterium]NIU45625.1 PilZ domain-containing protein [Nitrospinaceae bacterium]
MKKDHDSREFTRVPIHVMVEIVSDEGTFRTEQTKDLSMKGIFLYCDPVLPVHTECEVRLILTQDETPIQIDLHGVVGRCSDRGMGIEFLEIHDLDSYQHLQNLVMHNSTDSHRIEEEIHNHLGLKRKS